jgi:hypothetical protein
MAKLKAFERIYASFMFPRQGALHADGVTRNHGQIGPCRLVGFAAALFQSRKVPSGM